MKLGHCPPEIGVKKLINCCVVVIVFIVCVSFVAVVVAVLTYLEFSSIFLPIKDNG